MRKKLKAEMGRVGRTTQRKMLVGCAVFGRQICDRRNRWSLLGGNDHIDRVDLIDVGLL